MNIRQLIDNETCTYTYLVWDSDSLEAIVIDPVLEKINRDLDYINKLNLNLKYIIRHMHADHITGALQIKKTTNAKICYGSKTGVSGADILLNDNDTLIIGSIVIKAIHSWHTSGCTSYYIDGIFLQVILCLLRELVGQIFRKAPQKTHIIV